MRERSAGSMISTAPTYSRVAGRVAAVLVALFAVALLAGCGGGGGSSGTTDTVVVTSGGTHTAKPAKSPSSTTHTTQTTQTTSTPGNIPTTASTTPSPTGSAPSSTKAASAAPPGGRLLRRYAGNGNTQLGTIVVSVPSTLTWKAQHSPIQVFTSKGFILVNSTAPSGVTRLSRGTYRNMRVASRAGWSLELRASSP
jgi:hypothetical protein